MGEAVPRGDATTLVGVPNVSRWLRGTPAAAPPVEDYIDELGNSYADEDGATYTHEDLT